MFQTELITPLGDEVRTKLLLVTHWICCSSLVIHSSSLAMACLSFHHPPLLPFLPLSLLYMPYCPSLPPSVTPLCMPHCPSSLCHSSMPYCPSLPPSLCHSCMPHCPSSNYFSPLFPLLRCVCFMGNPPAHECVLKGMPPVVSAKEVELGNHGDKRRRRYKKQKQSELNCSVRQTQEAIDRARTAHQYNNMQ